MVWAYSWLQVVAWPTVFSCGFNRHAPLHMLGILLWFIAFLLGFSLTPFPPSSVSFFYVLGSGLVLQYVLFIIFIMMGAWAGAGLQVGVVAGLRVGQAYGVLYLPGFGLADYQPSGSWAPNRHLGHRC